ncbi:TerC family protein [Bordetella sp. BOR01]|uniref:TerC family protein n=1 Tax=Bordetella sp. BOR01 TaxID=2854779 RepID=UPI001C47885E|nr:TerC family protein [Bordetella sp. BOR01]MBV7486722.1 TerC family protein [Bordetella sp. BOR01]
MLAFFDALDLGAVIQIILIDILLGGDNAVVIALACRGLPPNRRMQGILWGTVGAVVMRVALISFALTVLDVPFLKIGGCLLLLWIGIKLFVPQHGHDPRGNIKSSASVLGAVKTIVVADFAMSLDNVIAIAGAAGNTPAGHQVFYVVFGLLVSVPIIVWGSTLVLKLMDRFPLLIAFGAGLLGWIAGNMLITDAFFVERLGEPHTVAKLAAGLAGAFVVVAVGKRLAAYQQSGRGKLDDTDL